MRFTATLLALSAGIAVATAAPAQAPKVKPKPAAAARDWRGNIIMLPSGAYAIGNPAAKVKLVEYLSYTCSHCAQFVAQSRTPLHDGLVQRGVVRVEVQHAVRDPLDMAASLLVRCVPTGNFSSASREIFAAQPDWFARGRQWWQANATSLQGQPELTQLKTLAKESGLTALMTKRGMTAAAVDRCFANPADLTKLTAMSKSAWQNIQGTPSFTVNGKATGGSAWSTLEPELRAAGAR